VEACLDLRRVALSEVHDRRKRRAVGALPARGGVGLGDGFVRTVGLVRGCARCCAQRRKSNCEKGDTDRSRIVRFIDSYKQGETAASRVGACSIVCSIPGDSPVASEPNNPEHFVGDALTPVVRALVDSATAETRALLAGESVHRREGAILRQGARSSPGRRNEEDAR
jgi:hypothetical protein